MSAALVSVLTALGDDELVLGHRHSEWTGFAPHIEEDVAFSSIAQDEIGHGAAYFALLANETGRDVDELALGRPKDEYRHAVICERENRDWAFTLARHWLYDHADSVRLEALEGSAHAELAALVAKIRREERYHLLHADTWLDRVGKGPVEARRKLIDALASTFGEVMALFEPFENEEAAVKEGILPVPSPELGQRFSDKMAARFDELGFPTALTAPVEERAEFVASSSGDLIAADEAATAEPRSTDTTGGRRGIHTTEFDALWEDMTSTYREDPGARW